ncbi:sensor histidine kinase [Actinophytocola xanthii]|uniref:histidine kinase n=1 Tax=Actinophytocola xanthii TaxID=1912961 RepID=A0A1Q8CU99_9PSEU|nr:histidine kinase [Actinophytocola xanthii]OLF17929.1 two-component sensor histidine kinase [Actinophytocola xanthii]
MGRAVREVVTTVCVVTASVVSSLYAVGAEGYVPGQTMTRMSALAWFALLAALGAAVMLCWRHRRPELVTIIALVPPLLGADSFAALAALAALAAGRQGHLVRAATTLVFGVTALAVWRDTGYNQDITIAGRLIDAENTAVRVVGVLVIAAVLTAIPVVFGIIRRTRQALAGQAARERVLREEMARREERSRIAHEMHDVLGHRLSLLSLQAGALEVSEDAAVGEAARNVRTSAKQSLEDLRQVIGMLRDGRAIPLRDDNAAESPSTTLGDLPDLVGRTRAAGAPVTATIMVDRPGQAPGALGTAVYRIVQESLTNVVRHAPGSAAELVVRGGPGTGVAIEVSNPLSDAAEPSPGSRSGLAGMTERAAVLGGHVSAGPTDRGTFVVRAWLPWESPDEP